MTHLGPVHDAVSKTFTAFDGWRDPNAGGLCAPCSWGYATAGLRRTPHLVMRRPMGLVVLTRAEARATLTGGPIRGDTALLVPLRPGRKHLLPEAGWGRVRVDDGNLAWQEPDAQRLRTLIQLRSLGFGSRMLTRPAPPFAALTRLPRSTWQSAMKAWDELAVWRTPDNPWLPLAIHISTPDQSRGEPQ